MPRHFHFNGYNLTDVGGRLLVDRPSIDTEHPGDYGWDPVLDEAGEPTGFVKLVPSGDVVTVTEARQRVG